MTTLTLAQAQAIIVGALAAARSRAAQPLAIVVLDAGAHPVALAREDGATFFRHEIATAKATGALGMGADTRVLAQRAANNAAFFQAVAVTLGGRIAYSPGGVLVRDAAGAVIGAVGVSGDTGDCDEDCALAGIRAAGLGEQAA
ncbi:heme-binding protein [Novosphingobium piscinae]|uniref:Heme-binding protein n=1 Tax=Novosphingobium piscinae TaxID=1507448 RepID=A0A7X1FYN7_9SPHN|nr:heme-binding protein [Novosphingobium piscinae]MBC2668827.1 heme-binding protein [Novosphingobium piscinae]